MRILAIGNSFSQDAFKYLHKVAEAAGKDVTTVNLYIGGCTLERHWNNVLENKNDYQYELNGAGEGPAATIKDALLEDKWDVITLQQASGYSGIDNSYHPYIENLYNYVKDFQPDSKIMIHETWAYEHDSNHGHFKWYGKNQEYMYKALQNCYYNASYQLGAEIIPCGDFIQHLRRTVPEFDYPRGGLSLTRDGFHMGYIYGRYALACVWYKYVVDGDISTNDFVPRGDSNYNTDMHLVDIIKNEAAKF